VLGLLTPKPFRGDVIAAGVVVLVTLVWTLLTRFQDAWPDGVHLAYCGAALLFVGAMAVLAPMESEHPRAYQSVLYLATIALWIAVVDVLIAIAGVSDDDTDLLRTLTAALATVAVLAFGFAIRSNSAACTLVGATAAGLAVNVAVAWIFTPGGIGTYRYVLVFETAVLVLAAVGQRDRRPRHGVALIDAAGLAVLAIALSFSLTGLVFDDPGPQSVAWGWELLVVAAGFGLIAYSSVDRQPGPAYLGVLNLALFTSITSGGIERATLVGWPIALAAAALFLLVVGLRPTTPAPPPPDVDAPEPPPLPLR
jgi:hypothetical protein